MVPEVFLCLIGNLIKACNLIIPVLPLSYHIDLLLAEYVQIVSSYFRIYTIHDALISEGKKGRPYLPLSHTFRELFDPISYLFTYYSRYS